MDDQAPGDYARILVVDGLAVVANESGPVVAVRDALADLLTAIAAELHDSLSRKPICFVLS
ncbi:hypothetical protein GCM10007418_00410 [Halopseudomonas salina]|uniref:Uncharacterized protein n=1 Tax=Halopseudomonas salina TaxID=1323744 RepID=A0ABQ1NST7_9GAMM|nr:hypothetical protein GCM10007418_00410 [Halopseudomonas salina]